MCRYRPVWSNTDLQPTNNWWNGLYDWGHVTRNSKFIKQSDRVWRGVKCRIVWWSISWPETNFSQPCCLMRGSGRSILVPVAVARGRLTSILESRHCHMRGNRRFLNLKEPIPQVLTHLWSGLVYRLATEMPFFFFFFFFLENADEAQGIFGMTGVCGIRSNAWFQQKCPYAIFARMWGAQQISGGKCSIVSQYFKYCVIIRYQVFSIVCDWKDQSAGQNYHHERTLKVTPPKRILATLYDKTSLNFLLDVQLETKFNFRLPRNKLILRLNYQTNLPVFNTIYSKKISKFNAQGPLIIEIFIAGWDCLAHEVAVCEFAY